MMLIRSIEDLDGRYQVIEYVKQNLLDVVRRKDEDSVCSVRNSVDDVIGSTGDDVGQQNSLMSSTSGDKSIPVFSREKLQEVIVSLLDANWDGTDNSIFKDKVISRVISRRALRLQCEQSFNRRLDSEENKKLIQKTVDDWVSRYPEKLASASADRDESKERQVILETLYCLLLKFSWYHGLKSFLPILSLAG